MTEIVVTQHRFPTHSTTVETLDLAYDVVFQQQLSDVGSGSVTLPLDDPKAAGLEVNDLLRFWIDGSCVSAMIVERLEVHTLDESGGAAEWIRATGRDQNALLEWGVIQPANGVGSSPVETDRLFNVYAPQFDDSSWDNAVLTGVPAIPAEFPAASGGPYIFGPSADITSAPNGVTWLRHTFTVASDSSVTVFASADNWGNVHIDGQRIMSIGGADQSNSYRRTYTTTLELSAGTHTVACRVFNKGSDNPGGLRLLIAETDTGGEVTSVIEETSTDWLALEGGAPGMTPGEADLIALGEVHDDDGLSWMAPTYDGAEDTGGTPWPVVADISTKTGTDLLSFHLELATTYVDFSVDPTTLDLNLWVKGTMGSSSGVTLEPAEVTDPRTGNLLRLDRVLT